MTSTDKTVFAAKTSEEIDEAVLVDVAGGAASSAVQMNVETVNVSTSLQMTALHRR